MHLRLEILKNVLLSFARSGNHFPLRGMRIDVLQKRSRKMGVSDIQNVEIDYRLMRQLNVFKRLCGQIKASKSYESKIRRLFRQSRNTALTAQALIEREFDFSLSLEESELMAIWIMARLRRLPSRKSISQSTKSTLVKSQNGKCAICGTEIDEYSPHVHVDHIIPWELVGDELDNNYQALCESCNLRKSNDVNFGFKVLFGLD